MCVAFVYICVYMYVCLCVYVCICVCMYACLYVYVHTCLHVRVYKTGLMKVATIILNITEKSVTRFCSGT